MRAIAPSAPISRAHRLRHGGWTRVKPDVPDEGHTKYDEDVPGPTYPAAPTICER